MIYLAIDVFFISGVVLKVDFQDNGLVRSTLSIFKLVSVFILYCVGIWI